MELSSKNKIDKEVQNFINFFMMTLILINVFVDLQVDILGQSIYELCHPCEHGELKEMLSTKEPNSQKSHFLRMKCTLTNKGRSVNIKSALYKVK